MSDYRIIWLGDSLSLAVTADGTVSDALERRCSWWSHVVWDSAAGAPQPRRCVWQPQRQSNGTTVHLDLGGAAFGATNRLLDLGHTCHGFQVSEGETTLGADWLSPAGFMYTRALAEYQLAIASTRMPASPGAANTIGFVSLGTNDCLTSDAFCASATFQANLEALAAGWRAVVGAGMKFVFRLPSTALPAPSTDTRETNSRAGVAAMIAADSGKSVSYDPSAQAVIGDGIHDTNAAALIIGAAMADAALTL